LARLGDSKVFDLARKGDRN